MKRRSIFTLIFLSFILLSQGQSFGDLHTLTSGRLNGGGDSISTEDIDNDGDVDILALSFMRHNIYLLENLGNNNFKTLRILGDDFPDLSKIKTSDVNNDGLIDIVYSTLDYRDQLNWLKNLGNNQFEKQSSIFSVTSVGWETVSFSIAELNGDGLDDIVVRFNEPEDNIELFELMINNGDGTFEHRTSLTDTGRVSFFQFIDFDNDNDNDIVYLSKYPNKIAILLNNGYGEFSEEVVVDEGYEYSILSFRTLDSDKDEDYDILSWTYNDSIIMHENISDNIFEKISVSNDSLFSFNNWNVQCVDLDNDNDLDIINTKLQVLENKGDNSFKYINNNTHPFTIKEYNITDINNNGNKDLICGYFSNDGISCIENISLSNFNNWKMLTSQIISLNTIGYDKINNDEYPDIIAYDRYYKYVFLLNNGLGEFSDTITTNTLHRHFSRGTFEDFNNDGFCDILSYDDYEYDTDDSSHFRFAKNNGDNSFSTVNINTYNHLIGHTPYYTDIDNDGASEVLLINKLSNKTDTIYLLKINLDFSISTHDTITLNTPLEIENIKFYDLDRNGQNDLIISSDRSLLVNYSIDGRFSHNFEVIANFSSFIACFDFANINEDPTTEIIIAMNRRIDIIENIVGGSYDALYEHEIPYSAFKLIANDLNNDGIDEVFIASYEKIGLISNIKYNTFTLESHDYTQTRFPDSFDTPYILADIDQDGDLDILCSDNERSDISWLENNFIHASIEETNTVAAYNIYPNPARETINIDFTERITNSATVVLFDNLGKEIRQYNVKADQAQLSIGTENIKPGIYFIVLKTDKRISSSKVLIVK